MKVNKSFNWFWNATVTWGLPASKWHFSILLSPLLQWGCWATWREATLQNQVALDSVAIDCCEMSSGECRGFFYRIPPRQPSRAWVSFPRWKESWDLMTRPFEKLACRLESRVNQLTKQICTKAFTWRRLKSQKQSAKIFFSFSRSLRFLSSVLPLIFAINQIDW